MRPRPDDPTMELIRQTAEHLGPPPELPGSLDGTTLREANGKRTALLKEIGNIIESDLRQVQGSVPDAYDIPPQTLLLAARLDNNQALDQLTARVLPDVSDKAERTNIALRLYAGYLDVAKSIDAKTAAGPNSTATRQRDIPIVEAKAANDAIYAAGVEAAPQFKHRELDQDIFRDGIPDGSIVLRDWDD
jgi:hypothetical protein